MPTMEMPQATATPAAWLRTWPQWPSIAPVGTPFPKAALIALVAIFAPSFLLVTGLLPFWDTLRRRQGMQVTLRGVNAAVVGVLLAALYTPVWTSGVHTPAGFGLALTAFLALTLWAVPPWFVVVAGALVAAAVATLGFPL